MDTLPADCLRTLAQQLPWSAVGRLARCQQRMSLILRPLLKSFSRTAKYAERWRVRSLTRLTAKLTGDDLLMTSQSPDLTVKHLMYHHRYGQAPDWNVMGWKLSVSVLYRDVCRLWSALHPGHHWWFAEPITLFYIYLVCIGREADYIQHPRHSCFIPHLRDGLWVFCYCIQNNSANELRAQLQRSKTVCLLRDSL